MENYLPYPISSSSPSSSLSLNTSNLMNQLGFHDHDHNDGNGFMGLISQMDQKVQGNTSSGVSLSQASLEREKNLLGINGNINTKKNKTEKKAKKPKHAFQTRSQVDILDDGYRWRKYGQKAVKNNKFPRYVIYLFI